MRPLAGSCACVGPDLGIGTETAFAAVEDGSVDFDLSCFFWFRAALSFSISFNTGQSQYLEDPPG